MSSRFSTGTSIAVGSVPIRTTDDVEGNAAVSHVIMLEAGGLATPIGASNPLPVGNAVYGSQADTVYGGGGAASVVSIMKGVYSRLAGTLTVVDTSVAGLISTLSSLTGTTGDVAYTGSGSSTVISALKGLYARMAVLAPSSSLIDRSGTVTAANSPQNIMSTNTGRVGFNFVPSVDCFISMTGAAGGAVGSGSFKVPAGGMYESPPTLRPVGAVSIFCATVGATFTSAEW